MLIVSHQTQRVGPKTCQYVSEVSGLSYGGSANSAVSASICPPQIARALLLLKQMMMSSVACYKAEFDSIKIYNIVVSVKSVRKACLANAGGEQHLAKKTRCVRNDCAYSVLINDAP